MGKNQIKFVTLALMVGLAIGWWLNKPNHQLPDANAVQNSAVASTMQSSIAGDLISQQQKVKPAASQPLRQILGEEQSKDLEQRFAEANALLGRGQRDKAIDLYQALIQDYPHFVEPYINLAAALATDGELERGRLILKDGAAANKSTQMLFTSINRLHGALAAQAYRNALETESDTIQVAELPIVSELNTDFALKHQVTLLSDQLAAQQNERDSLSANNDASAARLQALQEQLQQIKERFDEFQKSNERKTLALQTELQKQTESANVSAAKLASLEEKNAKAESDLVAKLRIELANKEATLTQTRAQVSELLASNEKLKQDAAAQTALIASATNQPATDPDTQLEPATALKIDTVAATELVQAWAEAWSAQDVQAYVGFYRRGYQPNANLTHQQWLVQRQIRLTNKSFIQVKVSDFKVEPSSDGFVITFTQHYRSNTLDDTIRKRLSFQIPAGGRVQDAKISSERIVRG